MSADGKIGQQDSLCRKLLCISTTRVENKQYKGSLAQLTHTVNAKLQLFLVQQTVQINDNEICTVSADNNTCAGDAGAPLLISNGETQCIQMAPSYRKHLCCMYN